MKRTKKICSYSMEKLEGCFYKMTFFDKNDKEIIEIVETPRFWLLLSNNIRKIISASHLLPVRKKDRK